MTTLPIILLLLAVADSTTHWPGFRWAGAALTIVVQCVASWVWWKARHQPVAVTYACPYRCGFLGDQLACETHAQRCQAARWAA